MKRYKTADNLLLAYFETLLGENLSGVSVSNYRSDINNFCAWFTREIKSSGVYVESFSEILPFLKPGTGRVYKEFLLKMKLPASSVNRNLSALRRLSQYLRTNALLNIDFMEDTGNVRKMQKEGFRTLLSEPILLEFEKHLNSESSSKNTVKNYVSDVRQFLSWLEGKNQ